MKPTYKLLRIGIDVDEALAQHAKPFESRSDVLRRLLGLPQRGRSRPRTNGQKQSVTAK